MFNNIIGSMLLSNQIQKEPWLLVDFISSFLGFFMNIMYNLINFVIVENTLGFTIIGLTVFVRILMLPMAMKQQKSMAKMQALAPELERIKEKYGNTKDPELVQKMNKEIQEVYTTNGVNPFAGCLPIFIQFPLFIALNYVMNQPYLYINKIGILYDQLATAIMSVPNYLANSSPFFQIAASKVPKGITIDLKNIEDVEKVLNKMTDVEWQTVLQAVPADVQSQLLDSLGQLQNVEFFLGIDLTQICGWGFPGLIIPILAGLTTFLSTYFMMKKQPVSKNSAMQTQQKVMMYGMPIFMGFLTVSLSAGVGVYWITSNVFQIGQQLVINRDMDKQKETSESKKS